jgi:16S rRNA (adenine1518-N6/adenine1519-N6)-dimethyltransferase
MSDGKRQTRNDLMSLFNRLGLNPRGDLGQNFLIDINLIDFIIKNAELGADDDVVLEVGSGTGGLTAYLAATAAQVVSVEYDPQMYAVVSETCGHYPNLKLVHADALANKNQINPVVLEAVDKALAAVQRPLFKLVANLPYHVGTPIMSNLLASDYNLDRMVVTIQLELAQRLMAGPGTSQYSALSVWFQSQCKMKILRKLPPEVFWPRPQVDSAILLVVPEAERREKIANRAFLHDFLRDLFTQRRKVLRGLLPKQFADRWSKSEIEQLLAHLQLPDSVRAEQLDVDILVELANALFLGPAGSLPVVS